MRNRLQSEDLRFRNGLRAADLPARIPDHELLRAERVAAAKRLRAAGASLRVIADAIGSSVDTARRYADAHACAECAGPVVAGGALCQPCSLVARAERAFTREEAVAAIRAWAAETGEPPRSTDWRTQKLGGAAKWTVEHPRFPSAGTVARLFGSWEAAQRAAGFTPLRRRSTKDAVIEALRRDALRRGRPPFYAEWQGATDLTPDTSTAVAMLGTWRAALAAAGLRR